MFFAVLKSYHDLYISGNGRYGLLTPNCHKKSVTIHTAYDKT